MRGFHLKKEQTKPTDFSNSICMRDMNSQCNEILLPYITGEQGDLVYPSP